MAPDDAEVESAMGVYLRAALPRLRGLERSPLNRAAAWLQARLTCHRLCCVHHSTAQGAALMYEENFAFIRQSMRHQQGGLVCRAGHAASAAV